MVCSGLFQVSKYAVADPNKSIFFLHQSIQEYLAAWYIMNEAALAALKKEKSACFGGIDSFPRVWQLRRIVYFMCEWSKKVLWQFSVSLLKFIGEKAKLVQCYISETPSISDLSDYQGRFRDVRLKCLFNCLISFRLLLHWRSSCFYPSLITYVFWHGQNLPDCVLAVTPHGWELDARKFIQRHIYSSLEPVHFFVIRERNHFYLQLT